MARTMTPRHGPWQLDDLGVPPFFSALDSRDIAATASMKWPMSNISINRHFTLSLGFDDIAALRKLFISPNDLTFQL